jgi:hypothetical protein
MAAVPLVAGKEIVKQVPVFPVVELITSMLPPTLSTMPLTTHSPIPVPRSPFVVKNGL